jgi:hypothetical protein
LSNLFERASKISIPELKLEPPEIKAGINSSGFFSITTGVPGFRFQKIINGYDLFISNVIYGEKKSGGFRVEIPNNDNLITSRITYEKLHELVVNLRYTSVYAYEIGINFIVDGLKYEKFTGECEFKTMKSPEYASLHIIDGETGKNPIYDQFITELKVEKLTEPAKSSVSYLHRAMALDNDIFKKIFNDIDMVLNSMR